MVDQRIADRRREVREQRRRSRLRRTVVVLLLVALAGVGYAVERSPLVALSAVEVHGVERLTVAEVRTAAGLPLGTSTLRLRLGAAERRVEALPLVASAEARRTDPLTVAVTVVERDPVAVALSGHDAVMVDAAGVVLAAGREEGLARIRLPEGARLPDPGARVDDLAALANAHRVMTGLSGPLRASVARYEAGPGDELTLLLEQGVRVRFGGAARVDEKVRALGAVLQDLDETRVSVIDVRAPAAPAIER